MHCKGPVFVTDYPASIKPFYMKQGDDGRTVRAYDLLVPHLGELIGGSEREGDYPRLRRAMLDAKVITEKEADEDISDRMGRAGESLRWYLDLRKYGSVPHSGWGMGFERLLLYATGLSNIRDVIPVFRAPGQCRF